MKLKNTLPLLLAMLSCACSQTKTGQSSTNLLPISSFGDEIFKDYASWAIFLNGLHGVYGDEGFYAIYPASKQRFARDGYRLQRDESGKPTASEVYFFRFQNKELKSEIDPNEDGLGGSKLSLNLYMTKKGEQTPAIQIEEFGDDSFQITFTLDGLTVGEGTLEHNIQIITVDDVRNYLSENLLFI